MQYKEDPLTREQIMLSRLEDEIEADNIVRLIDSYADGIDIKSCGFLHSELSDTGRRPYNPTDLLKLYLYSYLNAIHSSRKIERECQRNLEVRWLLNGNRPGYKTIANFRKDNAEAIVKVFREFTRFCDSLDLLGKTLMAIDGTRIRANNSKAKYITKGKLDKKIEHYEAMAIQYLNEMDKLDAAEDETERKEPLNKKFEHAQKRIQELKAEREKMPKYGGIALTDTDSKRMIMNNQGNDICHNVQSVVDAKNKLIVTFDVVDSAVDQNQLEPMAKKAKEDLDVDKLTVIADKGYFNGKGLVECEKENITPIVCIPNYVGNKTKINRSEFRYNEEKDCYICPAGEVLTRHGVKLITYKNHAACKKCKIKDKCTNQDRGRILAMNKEHEAIDRAIKRYNDNIEIYKLRQQIVEHPFGTIKKELKFNQFSLRGFVKVKGETALILTAYNFKRVLSILGFDGMMQAIGR
jgi:transposase